MEVVANNYMPGDPRLIEQLVYELKSQGIFDQFRKECISDVDTKPAYQNLRQRVEGSVASFLHQKTWRPDMNKNQLREQLRKSLYESGYLETGVERIVDQVVNPKINTVFLPQVEDVVYRYLGVDKPNRFGVKKEIKIDVADLLPTDLEAISPESDHTDRKDDSFDSLNSDVKHEEDESPPFEPLDTKSLPHEENSIDSHLSGFSGLQSHDSNPGDTKECNIELSNQESQISHHSSEESHLSIVTSEDNTKMEICDDTETTLIKNGGFEAKLEMPNQTNADFLHKNSEEVRKLEQDKCENRIFDDKKLGERKSIEKFNDDKKDNEDKKYNEKYSDEKKSRGSNKYSSKDKKDDKHRKSTSSSATSKDKNKSITKHRSSSSSKDRDKSKDKRESKSSSGSGKDKEKSRKDKTEKDKNDKDKEKTEKERSDKEKDKSGKEKDKADKDKGKSSSSNSKHSSGSNSKSKDKDKHSSSLKKESSSSSKSREKEKSRASSSSTLKDKSKSSHGESKSKSSSSDKHRKDDKNVQNGKQSGNLLSSKKDKEKKREPKKESKDDHYSSKDKKTDRRSTDRDSNDGQSSRQNQACSFTESSSSHSQKNSQGLSNSNSGSGSGDSGNSDQVEDSLLKCPVILSSSIENREVAITKYIKPKFASNFEEARKIMKIRKQLAKLERQNEMSLVQIEMKDTSETTDVSIVNGICETEKHKPETCTNEIFSEKDIKKTNPLMEKPPDQEIVVSKQEIEKQKMDTETESAKQKLTTEQEKEIENEIAKKEVETQNSEQEAVKSPEVKLPNTLTLQSTELSKESWDALEARLAQEMSYVNYNSYEFYDDYDDAAYNSIEISPKKNAVFEDKFESIQNACVTDGMTDNESISSESSSQNTFQCTVDVETSNEQPSKEVANKIHPSLNTKKLVSLVDEKKANAKNNSTVKFEEIKNNTSEGKIKSIAKKQFVSNKKVRFVEGKEIHIKDLLVKSHKNSKKLKVANKNIRTAKDKVDIKTKLQKKPFNKMSKAISDCISSNSDNTSVLKENCTDRVEVECVVQSLCIKIEKLFDENNKPIDTVSENPDNDNQCRYLEVNSPSVKRKLDVIHKFISKLEKDVAHSVKASQNNFLPLKRGRKRKFEDNFDLKNNNKANYEQNTEMKKRKRSVALNPNSVISKANKEKVCNSTDISPNESFSLPLSPAESDKSSDKKEEESPKLVKQVQDNTITKATRKQRYSSEDLYKPRVTIAASRRNRCAKTPKT